MRPFLHRYGTHCCAEQVDTTEGCPKIDLFTFKGAPYRLIIWSRAIGRNETILDCFMSLLLLTYWLSLVYEVKKYKIKALFALGGLWNMETSFRIFLWIQKPWTFFHQSYITAPNGQKVWFITCLLRLFCSSFTFKSLILCVKIFRNNQILYQVTCKTFSPLL